MFFYKFISSIYFTSCSKQNKKKQTNPTNYLIYIPLNLYQHIICLPMCHQVKILYSTDGCCYSSIIITINTKSVRTYTLPEKYSNNKDWSCLSDILIQNINFEKLIVRTFVAERRKLLQNWRWTGTHTQIMCWFSKIECSCVGIVSVSVWFLRGLFNNIIILTTKSPSLVLN